MRRVFLSLTLGAAAVLAAYRGGVDGFAATSPGVTGRKLSRSNPDVVNYEHHIAATEDGLR